MKKLFFISVMLLATMLACTKPEESGQTDEGAGKVTLLSESKVDVPVAGDIVTIKFKATDVWTAATDATWITLSVNKGDKGDECTVKASVVQNEEPDARLGVVTITCGKSTASVELAQRQASAFSFKPTKADVPAEGGEVEIEVLSNLDYNVIIPEAIDWVHIAPTKGLATTKVTLTVDPSYDTEIRTATIKISAGADFEASLTITQAAFEPYYDLELPEGVGQFSGYGEGNPLVLPADATSLTINVSTNLEHYCYFAPWDSTIGAAVETDDVGWIKFEYDNEKIVFTLEPNEGYIAREEYFYSGCFLGDTDFSAYGCCVIIRQEGLVPEAGASVVWTKKLSEISAEIKPGYNRLAYKTSGGDALLLSDGERVHVMNPADGTYWKNITWTGVKPTSIASDDAGNVIVGEDIPFSSGTTYSVYYTTNVNEEPVKLFEHTADFDGTIGSWRVRGDLSDRAVVTGFVSGAYFWAGWEISNFEVSLDNYYNVNGQTRGPIKNAADAWTPEAGAVMSLGKTLADGIVYRAYDTFDYLYYLKDAYTPNWVTAYDWKEISQAGAGGNENQNNMDIIDYEGRRIIAYTQGFQWTYGGNADVYFIDVTNPENATEIAILSGDELASVDEITVGVDYGWGKSAAYTSADVKLHVEEGLGLVCYVVNSSKESLSKVLITF